MPRHFLMRTAGTGSRDPRYCNERLARNAGFTVIELVFVIVIIGVLGAIAGPRFFNNSAFSERAYYDELAVAVRYAQRVAVASGCRVRVNLTATTYNLSQQTALGGHCDSADSSFPVPVLLSNGQTASGVAPSGITAAPAIVIIYDALGRTNLGSDQAITVGPWSLLIEAESGLAVTP